MSVQLPDWVTFPEKDWTRITPAEAGLDPEKFQAFVAGLQDDPEDAAITAAVIDMARALGARTLAEGVETAAQFAWLRAHGCDLAQGWHFARAMPANDIVTFCRERFSVLP